MCALTRFTLPVAHLAGFEPTTPWFRVPIDVAHQVLVPQGLPSLVPQGLSPQGGSRPSVVAIGNVLAQQRQPLRTRHHLEVPLQPEMHLRALDHRARGGVVGHLLKGHRGTQHGAGEFLSAFGIPGRHPHRALAKLEWRQPSKRLRSPSECASLLTRNSSTARRK